MANITVSPTRMELTRLKGKLKTAQRGHKLLKDKRDELMKQFLDTVREVRSLRAEVEEDLMRVHKSFTVASALMSSEALEQALLYPKQSVELTRTTQNIMSVNVPVYDFQTKTKSDSDIYPYGFAATSGELDDAVEALGLVFRKMLKLAQIEKSAQLMAEEIEKTRRRVKALEYVMNCGVKILATVHGKSMEEIRKKPILGRLVQEKVFQRYVLLSASQIGRVDAIFDERGTYLAHPCGDVQEGGEA